MIAQKKIDKAPPKLTSFYDCLIKIKNDIPGFLLSRYEVTFNYTVLFVFATLLYSSSRT